jgi:hypothetical protein
MIDSIKVFFTEKFLPLWKGSNWFRTGVLMACLAIVLGLLLVFVGCDRPKPLPSGRTVSGEFITDRLYSIGAFGELGNLGGKPNAGYALLTPAFINGPLQHNWWQVLTKMTGVYSVKRNNCRDFARGFAWAAQQFGQELGAPPAVLEFWYQRTGRTGHAINALFVLEDGRTNIWFWEPQTDQRVDLTPDQVKGCLWWRSPE